MKLIPQSHEIISYPSLKMIETAGRTCYQSQDKITDSSSERFIRMLRDNRHDAMLEFSDITVRFITNRGVSHELVRHRLCNFAQESTRYVKYNDEIEFILPTWWEKSSDRQKAYFLSACEEAENYYLTLIENDWRPEQAREVLPNALKTEIIVKANIREWRHIMQLRTSKKAHPQIRSLMKNLLTELNDKLPVAFEDIYHTVFSGI